MSKPYYIFLDDERQPCQVKWTKIPDLPWTVVKNYGNFKALITVKGYLPEFISFDHDLSIEHYKNLVKGESDYDKYEEKTGYDCAKWLVQYCLNSEQSLPKYTVHSLNPIGAQNIRWLLESYENKIRN